jgi:hypothetical protein
VTSRPASLALARILIDSGRESEAESVLSETLDHLPDEPRFEPWRREAAALLSHIKESSSK